MTSSENHARKEQAIADGRKHDDVAMQRRTIIGDSDGHWLITTLEAMWHRDNPVRTGRTMRFSFLAEGTEAVVSQLNQLESAAAIEMPAGSIVRKIEGYDLDTWQFRVDNGYSGSDRECFDVAYRRIETGDHLLYLKRYYPARVSSR